MFVNAYIDDALANAAPSSDTNYVICKREIYKRQFYAIDSNAVPSSALGEINIYKTNFIRGINS